MPRSSPEVRSLARRYFCCCIPVAVGSFITSAILTILSLGMVVGIIFLLTDKKDVALSALPHDIKAGLIALLVIFILVMLVSLLGLLGTVRRNRRLIQIYSWMVWIITATQIAGEGYLIYTLFIRKCQTEVVGGLEFQCVSVPTVVKAILLIASLLLLGIQIYVAIILRDYDRQLRDEEHLQHEYMTYHGGAFDLQNELGKTTGDYAKIPLNDHDF